MDSFEEVKFSEPAPDTISQTSRKTILHFSDGILEVDEDLKEEELQKNKQENYVDPATLTWAPWMWYYTVFAGSKALEVCDHMGEFLATFFGITTPKYQYEISEYYRIKREEEQNKKEKDLEGNSWTENTLFDEGIHAEPQKQVGEEFQLQSLTVNEVDKKF